MGISERARPEIRSLKPYASARSLAAPASVSLDANENPWTGPADGGLGLNRYPDPQPADLLAAFATLYGVPSGQILISRGSDEAIDLLVRAFCAAGEGAIAQCPPCFGMYSVAARIQGAAVIDVPLEGDRFELPVEGLSGKAGGSIRLVFLCSPNNPTGGVVALDQVMSVCRAYEGEALVVVDEAYAEFSDQSLVRAVAETENLAVLRTLSKAWSLAGARCGALVAPEDVIELLRRILPPYPLPTPSIAAARAALSAEGQGLMRRQVASLIDLRRRCADRLADHPAVERVWPSEANFLLVRLPRAAEFHAFAAGQGLLLRDFSRVPSLADCLRVTIGSAEQMDRLFELLDTWETPS